MTISIANSVRFWAEWNPEGIMVRCDGQDTNWREADDHSNRIANGLAALGVSVGDRVGILANNCSAYCEATLAILKLGAYVVPTWLLRGSYLMRTCFLLSSYVVPTWLILLIPCLAST